jgi:arylsulfatase A-like enzyme
MGAKVLSTIGNGVRNGIYHSENAVGRAYDTMTFPTDTVTLPKVLRGAGYRTIHLGKWHLGTINESRSFNQGFDETLDFNLISLFLPANHPDAVNCRFDHDPLDRFLWGSVRYGIRKNNGPAFKPNSYMSDYLAEEASQAIIANKNNPFFLYLAMNSVHSPLQALREDYDSLLEEIPDHCSRVYGAMILALDRAVGKILQTLTEQSLLNNTIVIFTSDNGAPNYISQPGLNQPFRGWKATLFEGGVRVPFLMQWPKRITGGVRSDAVVSHTDIFATALVAAGIDPTPYHLDGLDLLPLIKPFLRCKGIVKDDDIVLDETNEEDCSLSYNSVPRTLFWKSGHYSAIRHGDWKLQLVGNPKKIWLFDLANDPTERNNLAELEEYSSVLRHLLDELQAQGKQQAEPIWKSVSETPVAIDFTSDHSLRIEDDFIYWPN